MASRLPHCLPRDTGEFGILVKKRESWHGTIRPRAPSLEARTAFECAMVQHRWELLIIATLRYHSMTLQKHFKLINIIHYSYLNASLLVSLGRRPPKSYRGRAKVRASPIWDWSKW